MSSHLEAAFPRAAVPHHLGGQIRAARTACRWSQERLAKKVGATRQTIIRIEEGQHVPTAQLVHALEEALGLLKLGCIDIHVNRRGILTPHRRPTLTPQNGCAGQA